MSQSIEATFAVKSWEETPCEGDGAKLVRAHVQKSFEGGLEGSSTLEYLLVYRPDGTADFVGFERVSGTMLGRRGTFVLHHQGTFEAGTARAECTVVSGSGTQELQGLRGHGQLVAEHGGAYRLSIDVAFE